MGWELFIFPGSLAGGLLLLLGLSLVRVADDPED